MVRRKKMSTIQIDKTKEAIRKEFVPFDDPIPDFCGPRIFKVSQSKVKTWRRCHYAYHCKYRLNLRKKVKSRSLQFGSIFHEMVEIYAEGGDPIEHLNKIKLDNLKLFAEELEEYGNIIDDVKSIYLHHQKLWEAEKLKYIRINQRSSEHEFAVEIDNGIILKGRIDGFVRSPNSKLKWLIEHKTFSRQPNPDHMWRNIQSAIYIRAMEIIGWISVDGVMWDYATNKMPRSGFKNEHFQKFYMAVKKPVVDSIFDDFVKTCREMSRSDDQTRNIDLHCQWCDYEPICRAELQGLDTEFIKEKMYDIKPEENVSDNTSE